MVDLSEIGEKIEDIPLHLRNEHAEYWLLIRDLGAVESLERAREIFERAGWTSEYSEQYDFFLKRDARSVTLHVDTTPEGWISTRTPEGGTYEGPKWAEQFKGKLVLEVWEV